MKKLILLLFFWLFFLAGCENNSASITKSETNPSQIFENILIQNTWIYLNPEINIKVWTWYDIENIYNIDFCSTWYIYTYTYKDLWVIVTSSANYEPYFSEKTETPIFKRYKNIIYNTHLWNNIWGDYIWVFTKNSNISFENQIQKNHLPTWCKISTWILDKQTTQFDSMIGFEVIYFEDSTQWTRCTIDKEFPQREMPIMFVMNPKKPNIYYKLWTQDWCAPGPCSIFGDIEFF